MKAKPAEELLPVAKVAELWHCSKNHIYDLISRGELRSTDIGHGRAKTRIPESALADYITAKSRSAAA